MKTSSSCVVTGVMGMTARFWVAVRSLNGRAVMILGNQKGRDTNERMECNFGMAHPEGYRKVMRLMRHAERFHLPVITLIDIAGASIGLEASSVALPSAIAENLMGMAQLRTPILSPCHRRRRQRRRARYQRRRPHLDAGALDLYRGNARGGGLDSLARLRIRSQCRRDDEDHREGFA